MHKPLLFSMLSLIPLSAPAATPSEFNLILKPSPIGGVGVFATCDLPAGSTVYDITEIIRIRRVEEIAEPFRMYCIYLDDERCLSPETFDLFHISWHTNHSCDPNVAMSNHFDATVIEDGKPYRFVVHAIKDIKKDEEIVIDYNIFNEPESMKEPYFKQT